MVNLAHHVRWDFMSIIKIDFKFRTFYIKTSYEMTTCAQKYVIKAKKRESCLAEIEKTTQTIMTQIIVKLDTFQVEWGNEYTHVLIMIDIDNLAQSPYFSCCDLFYELSKDGFTSLEKSLKVIGFSITWAKVSDTGKSLRLQLGVL